MTALTVLHVGKFFPPYAGGMEVFLADLIAEQHRQGINAHALVHGNPLPDDPPWLVRVPVQGTIIYAPIALGFRRALQRAIQTIRPDMLHLHMPNNSVFWALTLTQARAIPWVVHWHADVVASSIQLAVKLAYRLYRPFEQAVLEQAERVIATSPPYLQASEPLTQWHPKCSVVPLGLTVQPPAPASSATAPKQPWGADSFKLLAIGRLAYYKGFETLIQAIAALPGVELVIAGEGESRPALEAAIAGMTPAGSPPRVHLLGHVDEHQKYALLAQCDVFCLPSRERTEAFGLVLLEAMSQARPCIASDLAGSGMPWVVTQAQAGLLAPPEDPASWAQAIATLQNEPTMRTEMGQRGQQALQQHFSMAACARQLHAHYTTVVPDTALQARSHDVLIVIPAKDEAATIGAMLQQLHAAGWKDVLVIDDQSTDGTGEIARAAGAYVLQPVLPVGAWGGMQAGIRYGMRHGYQAVITMDADGQHEVHEIPTLLKARQQTDVVIGSFPERASRLRRIAWEWFRRLAGFDLRDLTSGFRLYNRRAMAVLATEEATLLDYQDLGALLMVRRAGLTIMEVPVSMNLRSVGASRIFHSWLSVARYMAATTLLCLSRWR